mmetsp:Transcript_31999/g.47087  ORF Transcript_31999/g.47087 Transcript_31999/m.47087 type:complete len:86 (+) Transcript_31999:316-573(+)
MIFSLHVFYIIKVQLRVQTFVCPGFSSFDAFQDQIMILFGSDANSSVVDLAQFARSDLMMYVVAISKISLTKVSNTIKIVGKASD